MKKSVPVVKKSGRERKNGKASASGKKSAKKEKNSRPNTSGSFVVIVLV